LCIIVLKTAIRQFIGALPMIFRFSLSVDPVYMLGGTSGAHVQCVRKLGEGLVGSSLGLGPWMKVLMALVGDH